MFYIHMLLQGFKFKNLLDMYLKYTLSVPGLLDTRYLPFNIVVATVLKTIISVKVKCNLQIYVIIFFITIIH